MSDGIAYRDEYWFQPLPPALEARLLSLGEHSEGDMVEVAPLSTEYDELVASGHLTAYRQYLSNTGLVIFSAKGARYAADKAGYDCRRQAWEEAARLAQSDGRAHDWRLNAASGVFGIVAAVLGYLLGRLS